MDELWYLYTTKCNIQQTNKLEEWFSHFGTCFPGVSESPGQHLQGSETQAWLQEERALAFIFYILFYVSPADSDTH